MNKKLCVIIPAYNESRAVAEVVKGVRSEFANLPYELEVVVVDDHSTDNTAQEAEKSGAKIIRHVLNTGAGGATATGLIYADREGYDLAVTMDADGQHLAEDVARGVEELQKKGLDLLIGSRLIDSEGMSTIKVFGNKGLSLLTNLFFGINSTDSQSGLRVYGKRAIRELRWKSAGFEFCSEMLWRAKQLGFKVDEYPIKAVYTDYSRAKGQNNWNGVNIVKSLLLRRLGELFK